MNGPEDGAAGDGAGRSPDGNEAGGTDGDGDGDGDGGFEFGPDRQTVPDERGGTGSNRTTADEDGGIAVDLADDRTAEPSGTDPGAEPTASSAGAGPDPATIRTWSTLLLALAIAAFGTAVVIVATTDDPTPAAGAGALGVVFGAVGATARSGRTRLVATLAAGWDEYRRSVWFATGLFAIGTIGGIALLLAGYDLLEMVAELFEEMLPELEDEAGSIELTATFFILNNSRAFLMAIAGALTLGLLTAFVMVFNGIIIGNMGASIGQSVGIDYILVGLAPHGIFELPALFIAAGVGFRIIYRFGERVLGSRDAFFTKPYLARTAALIAFGWLLLVLAAFVEAYVTTVLLESLFADRLAGMGGTAIP
ncbi:stage II sporulation protein M [Halopiger aswanensis]|uniref:Putative membrane protein SpoIIM required for sporulation n=1 Tax=Halopiger aswanensis TaxID=148449 RepID=A0A3R7DYF9_9EURY|nr:stage II sporulation protein M [Halopiger aswanensis]RKD93881.1 putative membrane protein SpoIIM required for sporulation [Halopiger aswanensis]